MQSRVVFIGPVLAGKTWLIQSYLAGKPSPTIDTTIATDDYPNVLAHSLTTNTLVKMLVVDTGGQDAYRAMMNVELERADVVVCVVEITREFSAAALETQFLPCLTPRNQTILLVGNKCSSSVMPSSARLRIAQRVTSNVPNAKYVEVGIDDMDGVQQVFRMAATLASGDAVEKVDSARSSRISSSSSLGGVLSSRSSASPRQNPGTGCKVM